MLTPMSQAPNAFEPDGTGAWSTTHRHADTLSMSPALGLAILLGAAGSTNANHAVPTTSTSPSADERRQLPPTELAPAIDGLVGFAGLRLSRQQSPGQRCHDPANLTRVCRSK